MASQHHLAPASGNHAQFMLASLPFLAVLLYMLYLAAVRPNHAFYNVPYNVGDDDVSLQNYYANTKAMLPLFDIEMVFLSFFCLWTALLAYIVIFIPKRRNLMRRYLQEGLSILGNVYSKDSRCWPCRFADYAYVTYRHPTKQDGSVIEKRVRTYQPYSREKVTILYLPERPFSGQPLTDVEIDIASSSQNNGRDQTRPLVWFILAWMLFCLLGPLFVLHQMSKIQDKDYYERTSRGWISYGIMVCIVTPIVAYGGNWIRYAIHHYWVVNRGWVLDLSSGDSTQLAVESQKVEKDDGEYITMNESAYDQEAQVVSSTEYEAFSGEEEHGG